MWCSPGWLPPEPPWLARGTHVTERQAGEEKDMAAKLIAGDSSGEVGGATTFNTTVRIYWCPQLRLVLRLQGWQRAMAAHGHGMAGSGEVMASRPYWPALRASVAHAAASAKERRYNKGARTAGRVEQQRRRGPMRRWRGKTGDFILTKAKLKRWNGGGGRGEHDEVTDELGNAFSRW